MSGNDLGDQGDGNSEVLETYQDWLDIIEQLRKENDLEALNRAYENFSQSYFLPPEIWLQWIDDEKQRLVTHDCEVASKRVLEIVQRAINESLYCVEIWLLYLELSVNLCQYGKLSEDVVRERFEEAVTQVALDFRDGWKVFEKYWEFEDKFGNKDNVNKLQRRCASLPFETYPQALLQTTDDEIRQRIENNQAEREVRRKHEEWIANLDKQQGMERDGIVNYWKLYAEFETKVDLMRARMIYERGIRYCYYLPDLWLAYLEFLAAYFPSSNLNVQVTKKAFSCVPNCVEIAKYAMRAQERAEEGFHGLSNVFWKAWSAMASFPEHLVELSLSYLHCVRRLCTDGRLDNKYFSEILRDFQKTFDNDVLASADPSCLIFRFIATCFQVVLQETVENIRSVWEQMLRKHGKLASTWLRYIQWEIDQQQYENARRLFRRGIHTLVEQVDILAKEWIAFEGLFGGISQYEKALKITSERKTFCKGISKQPLGGSSVNLPSTRKEDYRNKPKRMKMKKEDSDDAAVILSSKSSQTSTPAGKKWHDDRHTVFVSNLPKTTTEEDFQSLFSSINGFLEARLVKDREGVPKGFGYVEFQDDAGVKKALKADQSLLLGQKIVVRRSKPPKLQVVSRPSRKLGIGAGLGNTKAEARQEAEEDSDNSANPSSQTTRSNSASWTQDDFRKWIQQSSLH